MTGARRGGRRSGAYTQAVRLLRMRDHMQRLHWGATIADLAQEFGVTERQVRRDLLALETAGVILEAVPTAGGAARIKIVNPGPPALQGRVRMAPAGTQVLFADDDRLDRYRNHRGALHAILLALLCRDDMTFRYRVDARGVRTGSLRPLGIVVWRGALLIVGAVAGDPDDVLLLQLDDLEHCEVTPAGRATRSARPPVDVVDALGRARGLSRRDVRTAAALARAVQRAAKRATRH